MKEEEEEGGRGKDGTGSVMVSDTLCPARKEEEENEEE